MPAKAKGPLKVGQRVKLRGYSSQGRMVEGKRGKFTQELSASSVLIMLDKSGEVVVTHSQCIRLKPRRARRSVWVDFNKDGSVNDCDPDMPTRAGWIEFREVKRK